ncbi:MAG: glycosyltransferase [Bacteroidota bacterium]
MIQTFLNRFNSLSDFQWVIFIAFCVVYFIRLIYLLLVAGRISYQKKPQVNNSKGKPISLLLAIRNEEQNIRNNLPKLLTIEDVDYEVVAVDDFSQDATLSVLGLYRQRYRRLKISSLNQETRYSVKLTQTVALKSATNDWVMIIPVSMEGIPGEWLPVFSQKIEAESNKNLITGYASVKPERGFFNLMFRIENFFQYVKSAGFTTVGVPFLYSEENVAFNKSKYFKSNGYGLKLKEPYANLELIFNSFITKKSTSFVFCKGTSIFRKQAVGKTEYSELLKKSFRIEKYLPWWKKVLLKLDEYTALLFLPLLISILFVVQGLWPLILVLAGIKLIAHLVIIKITLIRLNERKIFIPSLVYGVLMPYYRLFYRWHFARNSQKKWRNKV